MHNMKKWLERWDTCLLHDVLIDTFVDEVFLQDYVSWLGKGVDVHISHIILHMPYQTNLFPKLVNYTHQYMLEPIHLSIDDATFPWPLEPILERSS